MRCKNCGAIISEDMTVCKKCGAPVNEDVAAKQAKSAVGKKAEKEEKAKAKAAAKQAEQDRKLAEQQKEAEEKAKAKREKEEKKANKKADKKASDAEQTSENGDGGVQASNGTVNLILPEGATVEETTTEDEETGTKTTVRVITTGGGQAQESEEEVEPEEEEAEPDKEQEDTSASYERPKKEDQISAGAKQNIERNKKLAEERSVVALTDEEKLIEGAKLIKEAMLRDKNNWTCKVCGHNNPGNATSCLKCGRDRVRMARLEARGYDPDAVGKIVTRKKHERKKKERVVYLPPEEVEEEIVEPVPPVEEELPPEPEDDEINNYYYMGGPTYTPTYAPQPQSTTTVKKQVIRDKDELVTIEYKTRNRILAGICMILILLFIGASLAFNVYMGKEGSGEITVGYTGIDIITSVITVMMGGSKTAGMTYYDIFYKEAIVNGWVYSGIGFNQRAVAGIVLAIVIALLILLAIIDFIRCLIRLGGGKAHGRFHILAFVCLIGMFVAGASIMLHGTLAFFGEGPSKFFGFGDYAYAEIGENAVPVTEPVFLIGLAALICLVLVVLRFILGFFFKPAKTMTLKEAHEKWPDKYPDTVETEEETYTTTETTTTVAQQPYAYVQQPYAYVPPYVEPAPVYPMVEAPDSDEYEEEAQQPPVVNVYVNNTGSNQQASEDQFVVVDQYGNKK